MKTLTEQHKEKIRLSLLGRKHTEETKKKMSLTRTGKSSHWNKKPQEQVTCPHCGKTGGKSLMGRYHFDRCKFK